MALPVAFLFEMSRTASFGEVCGHDGRGCAWVWNAGKKGRQKHAWSLGTMWRALVLLRVPRRRLRDGATPGPNPNPPASPALAPVLLREHSLARARARGGGLARARTGSAQGLPLASCCLERPADALRCQR